MKRLLQLDPDKALATWSQIRVKRDELEQAPLTLTVSGVAHLFDADEIAEKRMSMSVDSFDSLPTLVNGKLTWKLYTNAALEVTKAELQDALAQMRLKVAQRAAILHVKAAEFAQTGVLVGELSDLTKWQVESF